MKKIIMVFWLCGFSFSLIGCDNSKTAEKKQKISTETHQANTFSEQETVIPSFPNQCSSIETGIQTLKTTFSPKDLLQLNQLFKRCLNDVALETRYQWLKSTDTVYAFQISHLPKRVVAYITELSEQGTLSSSDLKQLKIKMNADEKFVIEHLNDLYLEQFNLGEGDYDVARKSNYALDIFAPFLPKDDQVYLKTLNQQEKESGGSLDRDAGLTVSFSTLSNWIQVWEKYLKQYSHSHFSPQVKALITDYQRALFLSSENTPVFEINDLNVEMDPDARKAIQQLAKTDSASAEKAQKLLDYFDNYVFAETNFDEKTGTQQEYDLFMNETREGVKRFSEQYHQDLIKRLNLATD